jgi:hypothetical protein
VSRRTALPLVLATVALCLPGCGGGGDGGSSSSSSTPETPAGSPSAGGSTAKLTTAQIDSRLSTLQECLAEITVSSPTRSEGTDPGYVKINAKSGKPMDVYVFSTVKAATETAALNHSITPDASIEQFDHAVVTLNGNPADEHALALDCGRKAA